MFGEKSEGFHVGYETIFKKRKESLFRLRYWQEKENCFLGNYLQVPDSQQGQHFETSTKTWSWAFQPRKLERVAWVSQSGDAIIIRQNREGVNWTDCQESNELSSCIKTDIFGWWFNKGSLGKGKFKGRQKWMQKGQD